MTVGDLRKLLDLYQAPAATHDRLIELARTATQRGWWDAYGETLSYGYSTYIALENDAESVRFYGQMIVPGLLQTSAYAEEVIRAAFLAAPPGEIHRRVQARLTRQRLLTGANPLQVSVILDEAVLRRQVGDPGVMADQIAHLVEMAGHPNVTVRILPFTQGAHIGMAGSFALLRFPGPIASYIVYLENLTDELFIENEAEAYHYTLAFDRLTELALEPDESVALAAQIAQKTR